ncbi:hypothetical protein SAMN02745166_01599 [Prosthecobacter debontii]|uniref:Sporulation related domain-containing protein n=2 Tax=Prosthecobacter debontii TaxID=48467 RepID=A0A1T4XJQ7_9BACT|nr:hypothetical protein SAMN02745166_01599 [Prosthecobacter debontii]
MKSGHYSLSLLLIVFSLMSLSTAQATDKPVRVKPSKVSSAKSRFREKQFTDWLAFEAMNKLSESKRASGEQMIYYEYHEGKMAYRAIFSKAIQFNGWWRITISGEREMENQVNDYKSKGFEPLFVVLEGNFYSMLFVKPDQLDAARKLTAELGIEPPVLK